MDNIYKAVQLTIDSQNLALSKTPTHVYIANQYVDTNDTPLITAPFIIQKALENGTGVVDIVSSTIGSIYEVRLLCDAEVLISGYFYMPPMNVNFSELELYTSYPPRTPPVVNEFWQKTENFILEKTNTLLNFVQVFNSLSSMRLSLGYLEELATTKKSNLVSAINEVYKRYEGVGDLYEKNVEAGAGANGWIDKLIALSNGRTQFDKNNDIISVKDFGAVCDGVTDDRVAINNAAAEAAAKKATLLVNGMCYVANTVSIPDNVTVIGTGHNSGITSDKIGITVRAYDNVTFKDMAILNTSSFRVSVASDDVNAPMFINCKINARITCANKTLNNNLRGMRVFKSIIDCDFGSDYDGVQQYDVFANYGLQSPLWIYNQINVANIHRLWKITQGTGEPIGTKTGITNVTHAIIYHNRITGYGGKQVIDAFNSTSILVFAKNYLDLPDKAGLVGNKFTVVVENKTNLDARDSNDMGAALIVSDNTGAIACNFIGAQGNYGVTESGYTGNRKNNIKIINNDIKRIVNSVSTGTPFIDVRHCNDIFSDGNSFDVLCNPNTPAVRYLSNENLTIGNGDVYRGGYLEINTTKSDSSLIAFSGKSGNIKIGAVTISNFDAYSAIALNNLDADFVSINGLISRPVANPTQNCRGVSLSNTVRIDRLDIIRVDATHPTGGNVNPIIDSNALLNATITDCNWMPRFRGYVSALPTSGTYVRGDTLQQITPSSGKIQEWVCVTGNNTGGIWAMSKSLPYKTTTAARPALTSSDIGYMCFDTTLAAEGKPIWWTGSKWVDSTGTVV